MKSSRLFVSDSFGRCLPSDRCLSVARQHGAGQERDPSPDGRGEGETMGTKRSSASRSNGQNLFGCVFFLVDTQND